MANETKVRVKDEVLSKLKKFEASVKIDGKHPKHSPAIELAIDMLNEIVEAVDDCCGDDGACQELYNKIISITDKFER